MILGCRELNVKEILSLIIDRETFQFLADICDLEQTKMLAKHQIKIKQCMKKENQNEWESLLNVCFVTTIV